MFDEREASGELELIPYRKTTWNKVGRQPSPLKKEKAEPEKYEEREAAAKNRDNRDTGLGKQLSGIVGTIRGFVSKNEDIIILAVILLLLCDCDDDLELLIAAAILLYPKFLEMLH